MDLPAIWIELEADWNAQLGFCSRRLPEAQACALYVAVEKPSNDRALLAVGTAVPQLTLPESRGLMVRAVEPSVGGPNTITLAVVLKEASFHDVFNVVISDIVRNVAGCKTGTQAIQAVVDRVDLWQLFLEKNGPGGLAPEAQLGLFGELWFVREYLAPLIGLPQAIEAWTGPDGANQDFQLGRVAIEVKATASKRHQKLQIASERQLDTAGLDSLILFHLSVDVRRGGGESLPSVVDDLRKGMTEQPSSLAMFCDKLIGAGYIIEHADRYRDAGYAERERNFMAVQGDFPRIIESDLLVGVGDVHYSISVSECLHHRISADAVACIVTKVANAK